MTSNFEVANNYSFYFTIVPTSPSFIPLWNSYRYIILNMWEISEVFINLACRHYYIFFSKSYIDQSFCNWIYFIGPLEFFPFLSFPLPYQYLQKIPISISHMPYSCSWSLLCYILTCSWDFLHTLFKIVSISTLLIICVS